MSSDEVIEATAHEVGVSVVTQRGAVIGLELLLDKGIGQPAAPEDEEGNEHA